MRFCEKCLKIIKNNKRICKDCILLLKDPLYKNYFNEKTFFQYEFENYLNNRKRIIFAFSGGLDSVVTLHLLNKICRQRKIELICFTINHGFKGKKTKNNIENVIKCEDLKKNHFWIDISKDIIRPNLNVMNFFADFFYRSELPCGIPCNNIFKRYYKLISLKYNDNIIVTGGDTPKINKEFNRFSIFWEKQDYTILRGCFAFGLSKKINKKIILKEEIPWEDPKYGGYDTDCLLPGSILRKRIGTCKKYSLKKIVKEFPVILEYFSERIRWKIIEKDDALRNLQTLEISNDESFLEIKEILLTNNKNIS